MIRGIWMRKSYKMWLQCFYIFVIAVLLYKFCVEVSAIICDGQEKTFLKSYMFESLLMVISLIVIHRYRLVVFTKKINIPLVLLGVIVLIGIQVIVSLINGSDSTNLLLEEYKVIAFPTIVVLGPIAEELFFRGVMYTLLEKETDLIIIPLVISSGMFAIFHIGWSWTACIYNFFSGIVFALLYKKEESIWNNIVCHMVMNLIVFLVQTLL